MRLKEFKLCFSPSAPPGKLTASQHVTSCFTLRTKRETARDIKEKRDLNGDKRLSAF